MNEKQNDSIVTRPSNEASRSFLSFIWSERRNRYLLVIASGGLVIQFLFFKMLYPYPDFFSDSYSYLFAAFAHLDINIWPIGYSKFLAAVHHLTYSATALIAIQYFLLESAALYFFFTFLYFFAPSRTNQLLLYLFLFFNPLCLYITNYVNSDPLFAALSITWFTQLMWIIHRPRRYQLFTHAILLFLCFTVRNNAYYYPLISAIAFLSSRQDWKTKTGGILFPFFFIIPFVIHTRNEAYRITGTRQFSLFTGWQLANNALYIRGHIDVDSSELPTAESRALDGLAEKYFARHIPEFDDYLSAYVANFFIREPHAPLKAYFEKHFQPHDELETIIDWGKASIVFGDYGSALIKNHPMEFIKYFLFRNTRNYLVPPLEKLEIYNVGMDEVYPIAQYWFHLKTQSVAVVSKKGQGKVLGIYPYFFLFINLYLIGYLVWAAMNWRKYKKIIFHNRHLLLAISFWAVNAGFSIFATINVFRYQFFPMIVCLSFSFLLTESLETKIIRTSIHPSYARQ